MLSLSFVIRHLPLSYRKRGSGKVRRSAFLCAKARPTRQGVCMLLSRFVCSSTNRKQGQNGTWSCNGELLSGIYHRMGRVSVCVGGDGRVCQDSVVNGGDTSISPHLAALTRSIPGSKSSLAANLTARSARAGSSRNDFSAGMTVWSILDRMSETPPVKSSTTPMTGL